MTLSLQKRYFSLCFLAKRLFAFGFLGLASVAFAQDGNDVAMITAIQGTANLLNNGGMKVLQPFGKLKRGDVLSVDGTVFKIVYFENGRQETWQGKGEIEIQDAEGKGVGLPQPDVIVIPRFVARQIAKTPSGEVVSGSPRTRLRSIGESDSVEKIDSSYRKMRMEAVPGDLNPELFLLSALFELREIDRVEQVLSDLRATHPTDQEARVVVALYQKAVKNFREGSRK